MTVSLAIFAFKRETNLSATPVFVKERPSERIVYNIHANMSMRNKYSDEKILMCSLAHICFSHESDTCRSIIDEYWLSVDAASMSYDDHSLDSCWYQICIGNKTAGVFNSVCLT